jgi:hypothetical protein
VVRALQLVLEGPLRRRRRGHVDSLPGTMVSSPASRATPAPMGFTDVLSGERCNDVEAGPLTSVHDTNCYKGAGGLGSVASAAVCASRGSTRDARGAGFWVIACCGFVLIPGALHPPHPRWARETLSRIGMSANPSKPFASCDHSTDSSYEVLEKAEAEGKDTSKGSATQA